MKNVNQNKLIFGSDWPVNHRIKEADLFEYFKGLKYMAADIGGDKLVHKIFTQNAMRIFNLQNIKKYKVEYKRRMKDFYDEEKLL